MRARSPTDVILGEAVSGTPEERFRDMVAIASAIANRANALGVTPDQVVANPNEFNAYGRSLPAGANQYRGLAEQALGYVAQHGPVHSGMFYATPSATSGLPSGLQPVDATTGHQFFADPQARAIGTAIGYRQPSMEAQQQLSQVARASSIPTPTQRPDPSFQTAAVTPVERQPLSAPMSTADQYASYAAGRMGLLSAQPPAMANAGLLSPTSRVNGMADAGLLAPTSRTPQSTFNADRFVSDDKIAKTASGTISMLNRQAEQMLPGIDGAPPVFDVKQSPVMTAAPPPSAIAPTPGYVDPMVVKVDPAQETPPATAYTPQAPVDTQTTAGIPAGPQYDAAAVAGAKKANFDNKMKGLLGSLGAAAIGGLLAGPVGAVVGGLLGKQAVGRASFPSRPDKPGAGALDPKHEALATSKGNMDAVGRSSQAQSVSKSGAVGLF